MNNKRIGQDKDIVVGDKIVVFFKDELKNVYFEEIYEDENVLVINKKRGI